MSAARQKKAAAEKTTRVQLAANKVLRGEKLGLQNNLRFEEMKQERKLNAAIDDFQQQLADLQREAEEKREQEKAFLIAKV